MRESGWDECIEFSTALKVTPDAERALSLTRASAARARYLKTLELSEKSSNFIFEGLYTSVIELLHSLSIQKGFSIINHLCLGYFLRDSLEKRQLYALFDELRTRRNSLIYYGNLMDADTARDSISKSFALIEELTKLDAL